MLKSNREADCCNRRLLVLVQLLFGHEHRMNFFDVICLVEGCIELGVDLKCFEIVIPRCIKLLMCAMLFNYFLIDGRKKIFVDFREEDSL